MRLIDADALAENLELLAKYEDNWRQSVVLGVASTIRNTKTIDAVPVTETELKHLINDTITYIWRLEDRGCDKPEFGYDSRKALLEKLKQFYKEHFPENGYCCGEQKDGEG